MDKANRNFDKKYATRDHYGNITAKNQKGIVISTADRRRIYAEAREDVELGQTTDAVKKFHITVAKYHLHEARAI